MWKREEYQEKWEGYCTVGGVNKKMGSPSTRFKRGRENIKRERGMRMSRRSTRKRGKTRKIARGTTKRGRGDGKRGRGT